MSKRTLVPLASLALLGLVACGGTSIQGTWVGRDDGAKTVVYSFVSDGTGFHAVDSERERISYRLREGYRTLIELELGDGTPPQVRRGLMEMTGDGRMRLELGSPGGPSPQQLSARALTLRRLPTR